MGRNSTVGAVTASTAALVLLLGGCSGGDEGRTGDAARPVGAGAAGGGDAAKISQPRWTGPALPGLSAEPAWSIPRAGEANARDAVLVFGNAVVVLRQQSLAADGGAKYQADFRDAATGTLRTTVQVEGTVAVETWRGRPSLVVRDSRTVPASGTDVARDALVVTAFDENGKQLGTVDLTRKDVEYRESVLDGWVIRTGKGVDGKSHLWVRTADAPEFGAPLHTCAQASDASCEKPVGSSGKSSAFAAQTLFVAEREREGAVEHLRAVDPATGRTLWTTATVPAPAGVPPLDQVKDKTPPRRATVLGSVGDKVLLGWYGHGKDAKYVGGPFLLGLHDAATGRLVSTATPAADDSDGARLYRGPNGSVLYLDAAGISLAWDTAGGKVLWQQTADDRPLRVFTEVNGAVYAGVDISAAVDDRVKVTESVVLDARTKSVLAEPGPVRGMIPQAAVSGHAAVETDDRIWVFAPKPVA